MTAPQRIQRKRIKGWKAPPGTVNVTRPGKYGNPYINNKIYPQGPVDMFKWRMAHMKKDHPTEYEAYIAPLRGKNLMCWCVVGAPCHGDVLIELAMEPTCT